MKEKSIWLEKDSETIFPTLNENIETNVLIVGGGIVGILCAHEFEKRNIKYVLLEKSRIGQGTSKDTTAFITVQHETLYQDIIKKKGINKAKEYLDLNLRALNKYKELSKIYNFDYEEFSSTLYSSTSSDIISKEFVSMNQLKFPSNIIKDLPLDIKIKLGISITNQAIINPYKLIIEISKKLNIYENTEVDTIKSNQAITKNNNIVNFKHIIFATHYPMKNISGLYFLKLTQRRSYVCSIKYDKEISGTYCSIDEEGLYFRKYKDNLIIGGCDRDTGTHPLNFISKVEKLNIGPIDHFWSGQDCITLDGIPYIGRYSIFHPNYYLATGFNLWGYTWAMASSFIIADMIEWNIRYPLVNPRRIILNKSLLSNICKSIKNIITLRTPRCKHMGCALKYNHLENTWECPCHGTRYDKEGNILDGPAKKDLKN